MVSYVLDPKDEHVAPKMIGQVATHTHTRARARAFVSNSTTHVSLVVWCYTCTHTHFIQVFLILIFGMWCSASLAGAGSVITEAVLAFVFTGLIALAGYTAYSFGIESFKNPDNQPFIQVRRVCVCVCVCV